MFLLTLSMVVTVSGPSLSAEEALRVLRASRSELDRTNVMALDIPVRPRVVVIRRAQAMAHSALYAVAHRRSCSTPCW